MNEQNKGEKLAAVIMALHEYQGFTVHDQESHTVGIGVEESAWSHKLSMMRQNPPRKF